MDADGGNEADLTNNTVIDDVPAWSPNGTKIAYQSYRGDWLTFVMNRDGTSQRPRTEVGEGSQNPDWQRIP